MKPLKLSSLLILLALALGLNAASLLASGPPSQEAKNKSVSVPASDKQQGNSNKDAEQPNTTPALPPKPISVIKEPSSTVQKDSASQKAEGLCAINWGTVPDWLLVIVGVGATVIALSTLDAIRRQVKANGISARAAVTQNDIALQSVTLAHRPFIKVTNINPGLTYNSTGQVFEIFIRIQNIGKTPARVTDGRLTCLVFGDGPLPPNPDYGSIAGWTAFLHKDDDFTMRRLLAVSRQDHEAIQGRSKSIYVYGYLDYIDIFDERYRVGFAWKYIPGDTPSNLAIVQGHTYNYDRKRKPEQREGNDWDTPA